jgi:hypothetical protein
MAKVVRLKSTEDILTFGKLAIETLRRKWRNRKLKKS